MKVRITDVHPRSCHQNLLNCVVETEKKWVCGFKYEIVEDPAMSKLAGVEFGEPYCRTQVQVTKQALDQIATWINENMPAPKKLSWLQKIRGYDDLQARCQTAESMRDHYKEVFTESTKSLAKATIITEKSRELDLALKVADIWQDKLVRLQKENMMIGKRLKFSVSHNHIEIIVGNPVTACKLFNEAEETYFDAHAICNPKDQYDWKRGAIQSLTNLMNQWGVPSEDDRGKWFYKLFKKYPELK